MARPLKRTIDYFPHYVNAGKTLLILQSEFGNDGYAFWFKLLSLLCKTDGQVYDYNNPASWRLLLAETCVSEDIAIKILQLLSEVEAIDSELYQNKVIWVQNLVDNLNDVYNRRRNGSVPSRPVNVNNNPVNVNNNTQTKLNKTKLNKTIRNELPDWINVEIWDAFIEMRKKSKSIPTERAIILLIKELDKLRLLGNDPNEVLNQSIMNSWKGVFPLSKNGNKGKRNLPTTQELEEGWH